MEGAFALLMDPNKPFDVALLDQLVAIAMDGTNVHRSKANDFLVAIKDHPDMWKKVDIIIANSKQIGSKFFALQVLGDAINTLWKVIPADARECVRNFIVANIVTICETEEKMKQESTYLSRLNLVLVQILKQDWNRDVIYE